MATKQRGRPRSFDRETALEQAMRAFWEHGYDAVSIADLTQVMEIKAPSLYAAFGDKRTLFEEAVEAYVRSYGVFTADALAEAPTARDAANRILHEAAVSHTLPGLPRGCMIISAATNCTEQSSDVVEALQERRNASIASMERRIAADVAAGVLPPETDARALAVYTGAVLQGMSQQARDGADRATLEAVADFAMQAWPREGAGETSSDAG
ncbi:TetR/AcrR family transcriptional regulator [Streptomyces roseoverticillatus]|uniref:TetR/AcrR family transcriptional regulator n=1 Tax=Streptomyces roseoverticillatus TaxID=66429 RepID=UPI001F251D19|nr:TetR/AcrR family transcriptional regulator [Streptomyces roseoverticillatus]MCF3102856.1 TetR/AcrR family transcriptional regulator [Streptomyces roseoverticillatus]